VTMAKWPYTTARWQQVRLSLLAHSPLCARCGRPAEDIDHRVPVSKGGSVWGLANLVAYCHSCHSSKTRRVDQCGLSEAPVKGCDVNGMPRDPHHWWRKP
jgi:5-methylcytosine-specific restriction endonuclease McrA